MSRARECGTKQAHDTKASANAQKWSMARKLGHRASNLTIYKCPHCQKWHVGHAKRRRR